MQKAIKHVRTENLLKCIIMAIAIVLFRSNKAYIASFFERIANVCDIVKLLPV